MNCVQLNFNQNYSSITKKKSFKKNILQNYLKKYWISSLIIKTHKKNEEIKFHTIEWWLIFINKIFPFSFE